MPAIRRWIILSHAAMSRSTRHLLHKRQIPEVTLATARDKRDETAGISRKGAILRLNVERNWRRLRSRRRPHSASLRKNGLRSENAKGSEKLRSPRHDGGSDSPGGWRMELQPSALLPFCFGYQLRWRDGNADRSRPASVERSICPDQTEGNGSACQIPILCLDVGHGQDLGGRVAVVEYVGRRHEE